jgi:hypothetical protein
MKTFCWTYISEYISTKTEGGKKQSPWNCGWIRKTCYEVMKMSEIRGGININTTIYKNIGDLSWCSIRMLRLIMSAV